METLCGQVLLPLSIQYVCVSVVQHIPTMLGLVSTKELCLMQSFGAKNYSNLGIILQRALLVTAAACVLVVSFWTQMTKLLVLLGMLTQSA